MKQRQHPVVVVFKCGCHVPRPEAKQGKGGLICPKCRENADYYEITCKKCGKVFPLVGRCNSDTCPECRKTNITDKVKAYIFTGHDKGHPCRHRGSVKEVKLNKDRRPICPVCDVPGVHRIVVDCQDCGVEFESHPHGGNVKRCKACARLAAIAIRKQWGAHKRKEQQTELCDKCKVRGRRVPQQGENPKHVRYCHECSIEVNSSALSAPPLALPDPIRVLPGGDKLEHYYTPLDVAETANYYGAMSGR